MFEGGQSLVHTGWPTLQKVDEHKRWRLERSYAMD